MSPVLMESTQAKNQMNVFARMTGPPPPPANVIFDQFSTCDFAVPETVDLPGGTWNATNYYITWPLALGYLPYIGTDVANWQSLRIACKWAPADRCGFPSPRTRLLHRAELLPGAAAVTDRGKFREFEHQLQKENIQLAVRAAASCATGRIA